MKKILLVVSIIFSFNVASSQVSTQTYIEADALNDPKVIALKKKHDEVAVQQGRPKSTSYYMGYDDVLRSYFIGNAIPAETPKSSPSFTKKQYIDLLNDWIAKNPQFLKPEHKSSLITE